MKVIENTKKLYNDHENLQIAVKVLGIFFLSRLLMLFVGAAHNMVTGNAENIADLLDAWDSGWYRNIAQNGYVVADDQASWAFFPLYPFLMRVAKTIFHLEKWQWAGMVVSNICCYLLGIVAVKYVKLTRNLKDEYLPTILIFMGPWSFYFASIYTESLFCLLLLTFFYFCKKKNYLVAAFFSAAASMTKVIGVLLVFVLIYNIYVNEVGKKNPWEFIKYLFRKPIHLMEIMICPLGAFTYMAFLYLNVGDVWAFMKAQKDWGRGSEGFTQLYGSFGENNGAANMLIATIIIMCMYIYLHMMYKKRFDEGGFMFFTSLIPLMSGIHSMIRYFSGGFFVYLEISEWLERHEKYKMVVLTLMIIAECILLDLWMRECWDLI